MTTQQGKNNYHLKDANVFMGVSLSNHTFSGKFAKWFDELVYEAKTSRALVVLFDVCEIVNIKVFKGFTDVQAIQSADARAAQMRRMFEKAFKSERIELALQSEYSKRFFDYKNILDLLRRGYVMQRNFYRDIREQVRINLAVKTQKVGKQFIEQNLDQLSEYILLELAWIYCFFNQDRDNIVEVYPGFELFTKRKLIRGEYASEIGIKALAIEPKFIDIQINMD